MPRGREQDALAYKKVGILYVLDIAASEGTFFPAQWKVEIDPRILKEEIKDLEKRHGFAITRVTRDGKEVEYR